jgi:hypothetical protein
MRKDPKSLMISDAAVAIDRVALPETLRMPIGFIPARAGLRFPAGAG